jgi:hypothetical protein
MKLAKKAGESPPFFSPKYDESAGNYQNSHALSLGIFTTLIWSVTITHMNFTRTKFLVTPEFDSKSAYAVHEP